MKWITSTEGKVEGRGNNRPKPSTEAQTPLEKQQSQHLSDVQDVLSLCFSCSIVSLVGSGFFSLVSVFFSLVLSNVSISAKSGLSDMVGPACLCCLSPRSVCFLCQISCSLTPASWPTDLPKSQLDSARSHVSSTRLPACSDSVSSV